MFGNGLAKNFIIRQMLCVSTDRPIAVNVNCDLFFLLPIFEISLEMGSTSKKPHVAKRTEQKKKYLRATVERSPGKNRNERERERNESRTQIPF